jgi:Family of unknown function (DUF5906)
VDDNDKNYFTEIMVFKKANGPLTKRIEIVDGKVVSDGAPCRMGRGRAQRIRLAGLEDLPALIGRLDSDQALALGALREDLGEEVEIATKKELANAPRDGAIARTAANIRYVDGRPALGLFDFDTKGMPREVAAKIESLGGFWKALVFVLPPLATAGYVIRRSTSSGLSNADTGETYPGSSGLHVYIEELDGGDTERFLKTLHDRAWLAGLGWYLIGKAGQLLDRSIIDRSVGRGERLVFEGPPTLISPLRQDPASRRPEFHPGEPIDTRAACPPLTADEERTVAVLKAEAARRLEPERKQVREAYVDAEARNLVGHRKGMTIAEARAAVEKRIGGILLPDQILPWDDPDCMARVGDVLDNPDLFKDQTLADPIEGIEYGTGKATVMIGSDGLPFIHSFAHGGGVYRLRYDARAIRERIEKASDKPDRLARCLLAADVDAVEEERIIKEVAKAAGVGVKAIRSKIRDVREEHDRRASEEENAVVAQLNETYALVIVGDKTAVMKTSTEEGVQIISVVAFTTWLENQFVYHGDGRESLGRYWLSHPERRQYEGLVFAPKRDVPGYYNLWQGFAVEPRAGDCSKFKAHLRDNVCGGDQTNYDWLFGFFADIFQNPGEKKGSAVALKGKEGVGKSKVGETFGSLLGRHYRLVSEPRYVTGRFNSHVAQLLLLHADEAFWAGDRSAEGKLKDMITGKQHPIEFKGKEAIWVDNHSRMLATGNNEWVVPAGFDARRWLVLTVDDAHQEDHEYFAAIDEEMNNGGREALLYELLHFDLSKINLRSVPKTKELFEQKEKTFTIDQTWWYDVLQRGELPDLKNGCECPKHLLHADYLTRTERLGRRADRRSSETALGMFLSKMVGPSLNPNARDADNRRFYRFPPLKDCRARFAELTHHAIEWSDPDAVWEQERI